MGHLDLLFCRGVNTHCCHTAIPAVNREPLLQVLTERGLLVKLGISHSARSHERGTRPSFRRCQTKVKDSFLRLYLARGRQQVAEAAAIDGDARSGSKAQRQPVATLPFHTMRPFSRPPVFIGRVNHGLTQNDTRQTSTPVKSQRVSANSQMNLWRRAARKTLGFFFFLSSLLLFLRCSIARLSIKAIRYLELLHREEIVSMMMKWHVYIVLPRRQRLAYANVTWI